MLIFNISKNVTDIVIQNKNIDIGLIDSDTVGEKGECTLHLNLCFIYTQNNGNPKSKKRLNLVNTVHRISLDCNSQKNNKPSEEIKR